MALGPWAAKTAKTSKKQQDVQGKKGVRSYDGFKEQKQVNGRTKLLKVCGHFLCLGSPAVYLHPLSLQQSHPPHTEELNVPTKGSAKHPPGLLTLLSVPGLPVFLSSTQSNPNLLKKSPASILGIWQNVKHNWHFHLPFSYLYECQPCCKFSLNNIQELWQT